MSGATRTIQQPAATGSLSAAIGLIALILATALAVAVGTATRTTSPVAAPAAIHAPAVRDLGARDLGGVNALPGKQQDDMVRSNGAAGAPATIGYHGFGGPAAPANASSGSNQAAPAVHRPGLRPS